MQGSVTSKRPLGGAAAEGSKQEAKDGQLFKSVTLNHYAATAMYDTQVQRFASSDVRRVATNTSSSDESDAERHAPMVRVHTQQADRRHISHDDFARSQSLFVQRKKMSMPSYGYDGNPLASAQSVGYAGDLRKKVSLQVGRGGEQYDSDLGHERELLYKSKSGYAATGAGNRRRNSASSGEAMQRSISLRAEGAQRKRMEALSTATSHSTESESQYRNHRNRHAARNDEFVKSYTAHPFLQEDDAEEEEHHPGLYHTSTWAPERTRTRGHDHYGRANSLAKTSSLHKAHSVEPPGLGAEQEAQRAYWNQGAPVAQRYPPVAPALIYDPFYGMQIVDLNAIHAATAAAAAYNAHAPVASPFPALPGMAPLSGFPGAPPAVAPGAMTDFRESYEAHTRSWYQSPDGSRAPQESVARTRSKKDDTIKASKQNANADTRSGSPPAAPVDRRLKSDDNKQGAQKSEAKDEADPADANTSGNAKENDDSERTETVKDGATDTKQSDEKEDGTPPAEEKMDIDRMPHSKIPENLKTTVMLKNISNNLTEKRLVERMDLEGFPGETWDFLHLPTDCKTKSNLGYAFINFVSPENAAAFKEAFNGLKLGSSQSQKVCSVTYARIQGKARNMKLNGRRQAHGPKAREAAAAEKDWGKGYGKQTANQNSNNVDYFQDWDYGASAQPQPWESSRSPDAHWLAFPAVYNPWTPRLY